MKLIIRLMIILFVISTLGGCAEVASERVPAYPVYEDYDIGYITSGPIPYYPYYPYYYVRPGYTTVYHPGYYLVPSGGDNFHYHQK